MNQQHCENEAGYWLIEPESTAFLTSHPAYHGFAAAFFGWIANEVSDQLDLSSKSVRLEVIEANYHGAYPCLAAQHPADEIPETLATQIESAIEELLDKTTLRACIESMSSRRIPTGP